jgi:hypothetical protein
MRQLALSVYFGDIYNISGNRNAGNYKMRVLILIACLLFNLVGHAQKNDYIWLTGYDSNVPAYDSSCQCASGITKFDFNNSPVVIGYDSLRINFYCANSIISDSGGHLIFYSNGVQVRNSNDQLMQNGDSLGWGPFFSYVAPIDYNLGVPYCQLILTLPDPVSYNIYDIFYIYIDTINNSWLSPNKILRARVDVNANGGKGSVIEKDVVVFNGVNDLTLSAVRHGNGRDWWLCTNQTSSNCHNLFLYTGSDTIAIESQCIGSIAPFGDLHACRFSPDGNFYITSSDSGQISIFDFDRCTGSLNLREEFIIPEIADSFEWWPTGIEFSSDSRFFYIFCSARIYQYDLTSYPIVNSKDTIAIYHYPGHYPTDYYWGQLAPDGKIYINGGSGSYYLSIIDNPEGKGVACNFLDQSFNLPSFTNGLPYNPNYRSGALTQSQCDSLSSSTQDIRNDKEKILKVFPNPTTDLATIDYGFTDWNKGAVSLEITDAFGQLIYTQPLPMYSGYQKIDVSRFAAGMYTVFIKRNNGVVASNKLVVVH